MFVAIVVRTQHFLSAAFVSMTAIDFNTEHAITHPHIGSTIILNMITLRNTAQPTYRCTYCKLALRKLPTESIVRNRKYRTRLYEAHFLSCHPILPSSASSLLRYEPPPSY